MFPFGNPAFRPGADEPILSGEYGDEDDVLAEIITIQLPQEGSAAHARTVDPTLRVESCDGELLPLHSDAHASIEYAEQTVAESPEDSSPLQPDAMDPIQQLPPQPLADAQQVVPLAWSQTDPSEADVVSRLTCKWKGCSYRAAIQDDMKYELTRLVHHYSHTTYTSIGNAQRNVAGGRKPKMESIAADMFGPNTGSGQRG
ncbi:hypothetical protein VDGL01_12544 [Verticillium dahliae]